MRKAAGLSEPVDTPATKEPGTPPGGAPKPPPDRRAQGANPRIALPRSSTIGAAQPMPDETSKRALP